MEKVTEVTEWQSSSVCLSAVLSCVLITVQVSINLLKCCLQFWLKKIVGQLLIYYSFGKICTHSRILNFVKKFKLQISTKVPKLGFIFSTSSPLLPNREQKSKLSCQQLMSAAQVLINFLNSYSLSVQKDNVINSKRISFFGEMHNL